MALRKYIREAITETTVVKTLGRVVADTPLKFGNDGGEVIEVRIDTSKETSEFVVEDMVNSVEQLRLPLNSNLNDILTQGGVQELDPLALDGSGGTTGQFLQTDGSVLSWTGVGGIPSGGIMIWSGNISSIPSGWVLCDGNNSTPDLRDRFVAGAGNSYAVNATGGKNTHTLTESEIPSHNHSVTGGSASDWGNLFPENDSRDDDRQHSTNSTGGDSAHENRPQYHALAYIMKT